MQEAHALAVVSQVMDQQTTMINVVSVEARDTSTTHGKNHHEADIPVQEALFITNASPVQQQRHVLTHQQLLITHLHVCLQSTLQHGQHIVALEVHMRGTVTITVSALCVEI